MSWSNNDKQAGAELCQAQVKLGLAMSENRFYIQSMAWQGCKSVFYLLLLSQELPVLIWELPVLIWELPVLI